MEEKQDKEIKRERERVTGLFRYIWKNNKIVKERERDRAKETEMEEKQDKEIKRERE